MNNAQNIFVETGKIPFEGEGSANPLAFRHWDPAAVVEGKPMAEHLRFSAAYWHVMRNPLGDPFGPGTALMPWDDGTESVDNALHRAGVFFDFLDCVGIDHYCFHDRDIAPEGKTLAESCAILERVVERFADMQKERGKSLLWGTACLFANPRYVHGAATSPELSVYAYAAGQVKAALEATHRLGGRGFVFWGGREGYSTLLNTDMKREREHLARFLHLAVDYGRQIGFNGMFFIEPKPKEPTTHQYDSDAESCLNFLREFDLLDDFLLNIETNHATLAGHTMLHELTVAANAGALGSIDANQGDELIGWDTDQFPTDIRLATEIILLLLERGGLPHGGINFDAKRRRESFEPIDLVYAHVGGMDTYARGLKVAAAIRADGGLRKFVSDRYRSFDGELGRAVEAGSTTLEDLARHAMGSPEPTTVSGRQEYLENYLNRFL